jgi:hypothetical protein
MALAQVLCPIVIGREPQLSSLEDALLAARAPLTLGRRDEPRSHTGVDADGRAV